MLTIKNKLIGMTLIGLVIGGMIGLTGYRSILNINNAMNNIVISSTILRNHMFADMMHDALNSDVQAALLAAENAENNNLASIETELKEHSTLFTDALNKNDKLITHKETHEALNKAFPALRDYIASATSIIQTAKTNRDAAMKRLDDFHKAFTTLEVVMEDLTQSIEADAESTQKKAADEKNYATTLLIIFSAVGASAMFFISLSIIKNISGSLNTLIHAAGRVASGDLSVSIDTSKDDEMGLLARAMEKMRTNLTQAILQISKTTATISTSVGEISTIATEITTNTIKQRVETEQVAAAMNEMTATVHEVSRNISSSAASANKVSGETTVSSDIVAEAIQSIKSLANQIGDASEIINQFENNSHNISSVLDVIRGIAEQTNLLALNAAIEAARAGEQGRGFAVVADEVRTLASRTQQSTGEINEMIGQLQAGSKASVDAMNKSREQASLAVSRAEKAGQSLTSIATTVSQISDLSVQISTSAEEQKNVSEEINRNITQINEAAIYTANGTLKTAVSISNLTKLTVELKNLVDQFHV